MKNATGERRSQASGKSLIAAFVVLLSMLVLTASLAWLAVAGTAGAQSPLNPAVPGKATKAPYSPNASSCGPAWITDTAAHTYGLLQAVAVVSENDIWSVGGSMTGTITERWNGSAWSAVSSPNVGSHDNFLYGVAAVSASDIWAVGADANSPDTYQTLIEHWDGTTWSVDSSPNVSGYNHYLYGVAVVAANDVWAVGNYKATAQGPTLTLVEHWNGANWSVVNSPSPGDGNDSLQDVAVVSANDIWAVGSYVSNFLTYTLVEQWNGTNWSVVVSPNVGTSSVLKAITALSANDIWAVGGNSTSTLVEHWDGIGWSVVPSPNVGTTNNMLYGVEAASPSDIWAVGYDANNTYPWSTLIEHWNGTNWSVVSSLSPGNGINNLAAVAVVSANDVWAMGSYNATLPDPLQPLIEHYNPCTGTPTPGPSPTNGPSPTPGGPPTACAIQFSDVPQGSTFYSFIRCLACLGLINGYPDGSFKPGANVTRGQLSKIVSNAAGFSDNQTTQLFQDVPTDSTFFQFIGRLASRGFISGYPCGGLGEQCVPPANLPYFRPNSQATRGQISKIVSNAAGFNDNPTGQQFQDVLPGTTYYTYTYRLVTRNVMGGYPCDIAPAGPCLPPDNWPYFVPNNNATRGQTSKIVSNTFFPNCSPPER